ncbi:uncharacterized protein METZ01_LOCUS79689 [marine metagenome]|uniref:Uncharacterized protein n=1 Tax=marine metagenome TaxID=408172 RepID=A0A381UF48_9ZZZZ
MTHYVMSYSPRAADKVPILMIGGLESAAPSTSTAPFWVLASQCALSRRSIPG